MRHKRPVTEADLDAYYADPTPGEVWWCEGPRLLLPDGGKVRPVLVVSLTADEARVIPLTSRRPAGPAVPIRHQGGLSWLTDAERTVPRISLLSSLGAWDGFAALRTR